MDCHLLPVVVGRDEIEAGETRRLSLVFQKLLTPEAVVRYCERVEICVHGYEEDARDLHEIPEVCDFVRKLEAEFPYWCYFLTKHGDSLMFVLSCLCAPFADSEQPVISEKIGDYLMKKGLPAMEEICEYAGCSQSERRRLSDRVMDYFASGPDVEEI